MSKTLKLYNREIEFTSLVFWCSGPRNQADFGQQPTSETTGLFTFNTLKFDVVYYPTYKEPEINNVYFAKRFN